MSPKINPVQLLLSLSFEDFQYVCSDLLEKEPDVTSSLVYGVPGQSQKGIDILAHHEDSSAIVGQCKRVQTFKAAQIKAASNEFLEHKKHWSGKNVKKFILFIACQIQRTQDIKEIEIQKNYFISIGIDYEVWTERDILKKLEPHPAIIQRHFKKPSLFIEAICGNVIEPQESTVVNSVLINQIETFSTIFSKGIEERLESMRKSWREGRLAEGIKWIKSIKNNKEQWPIISNEIKAKLLRFEASFELESGNIGSAIGLADEAKIIFPSDNQAKLRALIANFKNQPEEALVILSDQTDIDSIHLKAAIFLEINNEERCEEELNVERKGLIPSAETFRLRAILSFRRKNLFQAQLDIQRAQELEPEWEAIKFNRAVFDYYSALSPAVIDDKIVSWPEPVDWLFIKNDEDSLARLRNAATIFKDLLNDIPEGNNKRSYVESWYLACLSNDSERQAEAADYSKQLLEKNPKHYQAIIWSLSRNFEINIKLSEKIIKQDIKNKKAIIPEILALCGYYLSHKRAGKVLDILKEVKPLFDDQKGHNLWLLWQTQALIVKGKPESALEIIDKNDFSSELQSIRTMALKTISKKTDQWQPLINHLDFCYKSTSDAKYLFELCQLMAHLKNWNYIINKADEIINKLRTEESIRIVVFSFYNSGDFKSCLKYLDQYSSILRHNTLSGDLKRLRIRCLYSLGTLPEALAEAELLVRENPSTENLLNLAQIYYSLGDLKSMTIIARQLKDKDDLVFDQAFRISSLCQWEDKELARHLWRKAVSSLPSNESIGALMELGYKLELDTELDPLLTKMSELGLQGIGGIRLATLEDLVEMNKQWQSNQERLSSFYKKGTIPIHFITEQGNIPLINLYAKSLLHNEKAPAPLQQFALFVRHGGKELNPEFPKTVPIWRLNLDITAILLAAYAGILENVEKTFPLIRLPETIIASLISMRNSVVPKQPTRKKAFNQIDMLIKYGKIKIIDFIPSSKKNYTTLENELGPLLFALLEDAILKNGFIVEYLPLKKFGTLDLVSPLPTEYSKHFINCRSIIDSLRKNGPLSEKDYLTALQAVGEVNKPLDNVEIPPLGSTLYLHGNISEILASAQILTIISDRFDTYIDKDSWNTLKTEFDKYAEQDILEQTLSELIDHLSRGLINGRYTFIPQTANDNDEADSLLNETPESLCLQTLLQFEPGENDVIWSDDRAINGYYNRDTIPIIGINEVLKALVAANSLTKDEYYRIVIKLRAGNVRFIPFSSEEIIYHINQAQLDDTNLVETQELSILRKYMAACLVQSDILQRPPFPQNESYPNANGETYFILNLHRSVVTSLIEIWNMDIDDDNKRIKSEWILDNLFTDYLSLHNINNLTENYLVSITYVSLITLAISMKPQKNKEASVRVKFFEWLFNRLLQKRFKLNPSVLYAVSNIMSKNLFKFDRKIPQENKKTELILLHSFFKDLPEDIQIELGRNQELITSLGFKVTRLVILNDQDKFAADDFWRGVVETFKGNSAVINFFNSTDKIILRQDTNEKKAIAITRPDGTTSLFFHEYFQILSGSLIEREEALRQNKSWFDCSKEIFEHNILPIISIPDPLKRIQEIDQWRDSSAQLFYEDLGQKLKKYQKFNYNELLPKTSDGLLRHFRIDKSIGSEKDFTDALNVAAQNIILDEGIKVAIERFAGFPTPLPICIINKFLELSSEDRRLLIKELTRSIGSPISKIHILKLICILSNEDKYKRLSLSGFNKLLNNESTLEIKTFINILRWVNEEIVYILANCPAHIRIALAWNHAHQLFKIFKTANAPLVWLEEHFEMKQYLSKDIFQRDFDYWFNVAHPRNLDKNKFLIKGFVYASDNNLSLIFNNELKKQWLQILFKEEDKLSLPEIFLLKDESLSTNTLNSFFNINHDELLLGLGNEYFEQYSQYALHEKIILSFENFDEHFWGRFYITLRDMQPYEEIIDKIRQLIEKTDFLDLYRKDPIQGTFAIIFASLQMIHVGNEKLRDSIKNQLFAIAEEFSKNELYPNDPFKDSTLLEAALNISIIGSSPEQNAKEFAELVSILIEKWKILEYKAKPIIQRFCEELPLESAKYFWPILLNLRARI